MQSQYNTNSISYQSFFRKKREFVNYVHILCKTNYVNARNRLLKKCWKLNVLSTFCDYILLNALYIGNHLKIMSTNLGDSYLLYFFYVFVGLYTFCWIA